MPRKSIGLGPIGKGWVEEVQTANGTRFIAKWQSFVPDQSRPDGRKKTFGGQYDLGPKVKHGPGLKSLSGAKTEWAEKWRGIMHVSTPEEPPPPVEAREFTFKQYVDEVWFPKERQDWSGETEAHIREYYFNTKLFPEFGHRTLSSITEDELEQYFKRLAKQYSKTVVQHCRIYVRSVFRMAHAKGVLKENVAALVKMPKDCKPVGRQAIEIDQFVAILEELPLRRDRLMAQILYYGGTRRGELFALKWSSFDNFKMAIQAQIGRDGKTEKDHTKTQAGVRQVFLPDDVIAELESWREWAERTDADDYVFSSRANTPINHANWLKRVLKPAARRAGIPNVTFTSFRRGVATELHDTGATDKTIQNQLGHSSPDVSRNIYTQGKTSSRKASIEKLHERAKEIRGKIQDKQEPAA